MEAVEILKSNVMADKLTIESYKKKIKKNRNETLIWEKIISENEKEIEELKEAIKKLKE